MGRIRCKRWNCNYCFDITGKKTDEDVKNEKELKELGFDLEDK